jgi:(2Fe-2S) ferredoxin
MSAKEYKTDNDFRIEVALSKMRDGSSKVQLQIENPAQVLTNTWYINLTPSEATAIAEHLLKGAQLLSTKTVEGD